MRAPRAPPSAKPHRPASHATRRAPGMEIHPDAMPWIPVTAWQRATHPTQTTRPPWAEVTTVEIPEALTWAPIWM